MFAKVTVMVHLQADTLQNHFRMIMLEREAIITRHDGCPNRHHCRKDEKQCCYLVKGKCYLETESSEDFV